MRTIRKVNILLFMAISTPAEDADQAQLIFSWLEPTPHVRFGRGFDLVLRPPINIKQVNGVDICRYASVIKDTGRRIILSRYTVECKTSKFIILSFVAECLPLSLSSTPHSERTASPAWPCSRPFRASRRQLLPKKMHLSSSRLLYLKPTGLLPATAAFCARTRPAMSSSSAAH